MDSSRDVAKSVQISPPGAILNNPEIPGLSDYSVKPDHVFWKVFPTNYPEGPRRNDVNVKALEELIRACERYWILPEKYAAQKAVARLTGFLPVKLRKPLPGIKKKPQNRLWKTGRR